MSPPLPPPPDGRPVVLYDGTCAWCTGWAAWLVRRDRAGRFRLAPLEGETAARYLGGTPPTDTMVLVVPDDARGARLLTRSAAVLGVLGRLGWPWRTLGVLGLVPRPLADAAYDWVARRRHALSPGAACDPDAVPPARRLP